ncbi:MAG: helix-turn-helix transcriptional regulator [Rhizobiaceae bacterium]|nr:helix-turn-helix transcriptional regulator [Rhizobiaceae bacterium]
MESESETTRSIILLIPRAFLDEAVQPFAMHGLTVTDTALGRIFAELLRALPDELSSVPATQAPSLAQAIRDMLAAALNQSRRSLDQPKALPLFGRAKRHIEAHLGDEISAASLASALRTSRSTLSRLFAATGGVESYMRRRRLQRAHRKLRRAQDVRTVAELAYALGFKSPSHFGRLFRSEYGYSPGTLRAGLTVPDAAGHRPAEPAIQTFLRWQHEQI